MEVTSELYNIRVDVTFGLENGGVEVHHLNWSIKEQYVQRHENNGEHPVIGELKYVVQNGLSKTGREMEGKRGWEVIRGVIYKGLVNCDKLFALYPEGNGKPLKWFMLRSDMNRFTFGED